MGNKIAICHWDNGGHWEAITVSASALNGHDNHEMDIWPPVEDLTEGQNWPSGETIYLNGCVLEASPEPSPSASVSGTPSASPTLPETGPGETTMMSLVGVALIMAGAWMKWRSHRAGP